MLRRLDQWIRRRLRAIAWRQWKRGRTRYAELRRRGAGSDLAAQTAGSPHRPWGLSNSPALAIALPNVFFGSIGLPPPCTRPSRITRRTAVYGPVRTVVWEGWISDDPPYPDRARAVPKSGLEMDRIRRIRFPICPYNKKG